MRSGKEGLQPARDSVAKRLAIALSLLVAGMLLASGPALLAQGTSRTAHSAPASKTDFLQSVASVYARLRLLPSLEKRMVASAAQARKAAFYAHKRAEARRLIDEHMLRARALASNAEERQRLEQLATLTGLADARFAQVRAILATSALATLAEHQPHQLTMEKEILQ